jgi:hypothetical protein
VAIGRAGSWDWRCGTQRRDRLEKDTGEAILSQNTSPVKHPPCEIRISEGKRGNTGMALANGVDYVHRHVVILLESLTLLSAAD